MLRKITSKCYRCGLPVHNMVVHEFWGFLGRRIARAALGVGDTKVQIADFDKSIDAITEQILSRERYKYLDIGFAANLRNYVIHAVGYVAASNVDLAALPKNLIQAGDEAILNQFIEKFGPPKSWYRGLVSRTRNKHWLALMTKGITKERTPIDKLLKPILEAFEFVPFIKNEGVVQQAAVLLNKPKSAKKELSSGEE